MALVWCPVDLSAVPPALSSLASLAAGAQSGRGVVNSIVEPAWTSVKANLIENKSKSKIGQVADAKTLACE